MELYKNKTKTIWYKAAALGSIWASFEIVLGSFLHNVRFPLSGTLLATLGVILMITFAQLWNEKGLFIKAGLIAALMKSISPSAILIGPMTGIFIEALFVEISIFLIGRNIFGYLIAGITALYSVVIHKVATLLILYGFDIVRITENLYFFLSKQLNINNLSFLNALLILSFAYVILGFFAALIGFYTGKITKQSNKNNLEFNVKGFKKDFLDIKTTQKFSVYFLILHLITITSIFIIISNLALEFSVIISVIYLIFCFFRYKSTFRHFKKVGFWIQILIILIISVLFYSGVQNLSLLNKDGLIAGLTMILRMFVLVVGFAAISVELRNPFVKAVLFRNGFGNLYHSLGLAFSILPVLMEKTTNPKVLVKQPRKSIVSIVQNANSIYENFVENIKQRKVIIITGERGEGKSTYLLNLTKILKEKDVSIGGFIAKGHVKEGKRSGFSIVDLHSGKEMLLSSVEKIGETKIGKFYFDSNALEFGKNITSYENISKDRFVVIDEIGPLELKSQGWSSVVEQIFESPEIMQIWAVRKDLVNSVLRRFAVSEATIFDIKNDDIESVIEII
ncbi:MAG: hypothetical protein JXL97_18930 [Bacteroidales bacterium]|nr:hypothetical protein [Bacteroidales bacterium]